MTQISQNPCLSLSRIRPGFQIGYSMKVLVMVTFRSWLFRFGEKHTMKNYHFKEGKLTQNLLSFQRVQDRFDCSNFNFKASKLILNHCKKWTSFDNVVQWIVPEYILTCNTVDFFFSSSPHWHHIIGWVRKSGPMAHVLNKKKKVKSDRFTNHSVAQVSKL